jgi:hypothetical protein
MRPAKEGKIQVKRGFVIMKYKTHPISPAMFLFDVIDQPPDIISHL